MVSIIEWIYKKMFYKTFRNAVILLRLQVLFVTYCPICAGNGNCSMQNRDEHVAPYL